MESEHYVLIVNPVIQAVFLIVAVVDNEVGKGFPKGFKARALGESLLEEVFVAVGGVSHANADELGAF